MKNLAAYHYFERNKFEILYENILYSESAINDAKKRFFEPTPLPSPPTSPPPHIWGSKKFKIFARY